MAGGACGELSADPGRPVATGAAPSRPRESRHHLYLARSYRDPRRYGGCGRRGAAGAVAGTAGRMSKRPRQGRPVAFATITPERPQPDPVLGLQFTIEARRSEEHTSDLQSLMRNSYAVFCVKKKIATTQQITTQLWSTAKQ